jgi:hypothetical protein
MLVESVGEGLALLTENLTRLEHAQNSSESQAILSSMRSVLRTITSLHPSWADVADWPTRSTWISLDL